MEYVGGSTRAKRELLTIEDTSRGVTVMMSASFGREIAESHFRQLFEEAEHDRLVGCLKRQRRQRHRGHAVPAQRKAAQPCPQDLG